MVTSNHGGCGGGVAAQRLRQLPTSEKQVVASEPQAPQLDISLADQGMGHVCAGDALPMLDIRLVMAAGSSQDHDLPGVASLTSALTASAEALERMTSPGAGRSWRQLFQQLPGHGHHQPATLSAVEYRQPVVALFNQVIGSPSFPEEALDRLRTRAIQGLRMEQQVPGPQVSKAFMSTVFADHPYGQPSEGTMESLPKIQRQQLVDFYNTYYAAGNTVIAMVGDLSRSEAEEIAAQISAALPAGPAAPELPRAEALSERKREHINFPSAQTHILLGNQATWRGNPDHVALHVGNQILGGGGFASILTDEVRQKRGYVYGIGSGFSAMAAGGPFQVQFKTANADEALTLTLDLIDTFVEDGPSQAQLEQARANILGSFALSTADNSDIIGQLGAIGFYDLPLDYLQWFNRQVRQVTVEDIRDAFRRTLDVDDLAIVSIGPEAPQVLEDQDNENGGEKDADSGE